MNELEQLYQSLIENKVSVKNEKHQNVLIGCYYTDTVYSFGPYKMVETKHTKNSRNPLKSYTIIFKNDRPLSGFDAKTEQGIYSDVKNKNAGKHIVNPYRNIEMTNIYAKQYQ